MKILVSNLAWVEKKDLTVLQMQALRADLTIRPRKVGNHPGDPPSPIPMFVETEYLFGMAREYFLARRRPHHQVEFKTTTGDKTAWSDLTLNATLRGEQQEALQVILKEFHSGKLGGIVRASPGWG